jgi:cytochrome c oxidase assembly protein subunit 15
MAHLLGGLTTLGLLCWLLLASRPGGHARLTRRTPWLAVGGLAILVVQIALGGWTSSNYAALACPDIPTCQGQWWPEDSNFAEGFVLWRGLGVNYEFGVLDAPSRVAIHFAHRLGALAAFTTLLLIGLRFRAHGAAPQVRQAASLVLGAVTLQVLIGAGVIWFGLPLPLATAHNAVAALLLLTMVNLVHAASFHGHRHAI